MNSALTIEKHTLKRQQLSTREQVAEILTQLFGNEEAGVVFSPQNTVKRTGGGNKLSKYELKISISWSAELIGSPLIVVNCIGMTMTEFVKEYNNLNIHYIISNQFNYQDITIYKNEPEFKTYGRVTNIDKRNNLISLHIAGLLFFDEITTNISPKTPKWLIYVHNKCYASFTCKIYQSWRSLQSLENVNWEKVWATFKLDTYLK